MVQESSQRIVTLGRGQDDTGNIRTMVGKVLISSDQIADRVAEMGRRISDDYRGRNITMIAILKGSFMFLADLVRAIDPEVPIQIDFMAASSYGVGTKSSGTIHIEKDHKVNVEGRDVMIVEDIIDTGLTVHHIRNILMARNARTITLTALLEKPGKAVRPATIDYLGFQIEDRFVVGYGLDHAERYRNLKDVRYLDE